MATSTIGLISPVLHTLQMALALASVGVIYRDRLGAIAEDVTAHLGTLAASTPMWLIVTAVLLGLGLVVAAALVIRRGRGAIAGLLASFRDGLVTVGRTGRSGAVLLSTVLLWATYGLMADLPMRLLGMDEAFGLGLLDAWAVMAIGGIGMALPAPGGTGSFHYASVQALTLLFAVAVTPAATYALLVHASGIVFYCILGIAALVWQGTSFGTVAQQARAQAA